MAEGTFEGAGLSSKCYESCPDYDFAQIADAIEARQTDIAKVRDTISPLSIQTLEGAAAAEYRVGMQKASAAAVRCATGEPWRHGEARVCGSVPGHTVTTVNLSTGARTSDHAVRPDPEPQQQRPI